MRTPHACSIARAIPAMPALWCSVTATGTLADPPPIPLTTPEMDAVYDLPYARAPHPAYGDAKIPAWEMIRFSVNDHARLLWRLHLLFDHRARGPHYPEPFAKPRSCAKSRDPRQAQGFTGVISDIGGPTANMYRMACKDRRPRPCAAARPASSRHLPEPQHRPRRADRSLSQGPSHAGLKKVHGRLGRALRSRRREPGIRQELVTHHVGGYLKIAPEHTQDGPLAKMMKPGIGTYDRFKKMFDQAARKADKQYFLIPYFIAAHPGTTDEDMMHLALWLKQNKYRADQVQTFLPSPMAVATAMYHTGVNPLRAVRRAGSEAVEAIKGTSQRRLHKAFLRYHDPENWPCCARR